MCGSDREAGKAGHRDYYYITKARIREKHQAGEPACYHYKTEQLETYSTKTTLLRKLRYWR